MDQTVRLHGFLKGRRSEPRRLRLLLAAERQELVIENLIARPVALLRQRKRIAPYFLQFANEVRAASKIGVFELFLRLPKHLCQDLKIRPRTFGVFAFRNLFVLADA